MGQRQRALQAPDVAYAKEHTVVTQVEVTNQFPLAELSTMADNKAKLIQDIDMLNNYGKSMNGELHNIRLFYDKTQSSTKSDSSMTRPRAPHNRAEL